MLSRHHCQEAVPGSTAKSPRTATNRIPRMASGKRHLCLGNATKTASVPSVPSGAFFGLDFQFLG